RLHASRGRRRRACRRGARRMISAVIPAHDEERYAGRTLATLRAATPFEVLVVANACRDRTADVARAAGAAVLRTSARGVSHARNLGARASRGELLLFLDADTTLAPGALDAIAAAVPARAEDRKSTRLN